MCREFLHHRQVWLESIECLLPHNYNDAVERGCRVITYATSREITPCQDSLGPIYCPDQNYQSRISVPTSFADPSCAELSIITHAYLDCICLLTYTTWLVMYDLFQARSLFPSISAGKNVCKGNLSGRRYLHWYGKIRFQRQAQDGES